MPDEAKYGTVPTPAALEQEPKFSDGPGLALKIPTLTEGQTWRDVAHMNVGNVSPNKKLRMLKRMLKSGRHRN